MNYQNEKKLGKPEIFVGIVSRMGTDVDLFKDLLESIIAKYGYQSKEIKVSSEVKKYLVGVPEYNSLDERYNSLIEMCNIFRKKSQQRDILLTAAVVKIQDIRQEIAGGLYNPSRGTCYVVNQLKRPEEISLFRKIYGRQAIVFSLHASATAREQRLSEKIARDHPEKTSPNEWRSKAVELLRRDDKEEENKYGQDVQGAFPLADFVVNMGENKSQIRKKLKRFFDAYFSSPYSAPNIDETGMNFAYHSSLASTDLSRQVGAAIVSESGCVLVSGYNDAPRGEGGHYLEGEANSQRDVDLGEDSNEVHKERILINLLQNMCDEGWLDSKNLPVEKITDIYNHLKNKEIEESRVSRSDIFNLLEFGRSVHAEMSLISSAAREGISLKGRTLYCTTYPCHNCAKHIVASGIREVVYLEPYPKSLVRSLHRDSIVNIDEPDEDLRSVGPSRVIFRQFTGVAPHRYASLFRRKRRKDDFGKVVEWSPSSSSVANDVYFEGYFFRERKAIERLKNVLDSWNE